MAGILFPSTVSTKQKRIAQLAREDPGRALHSLSHYIDLEWLIEAHRRTRKDGAKGIDGMTGAEYAVNLEANLQALLTRAKSGDNYKAPPVRRVNIPKGDGTFRPLGITTFEDKVLQRAVVIPESSLPHGHVLAVTGMLEKLGVPKLLFGKRHHMRELALALVAGRVIEPGSKLSLAQALAKGAEHHSLGEVLGLGELGKAIDPENSERSQEKRAAGEFYPAMDWLLERQARVEDALAKRHLGSGCTVLYDLSSSYFEGSTCPWPSTAIAGIIGRTAPRSSTACSAMRMGSP